LQFFFDRYVDGLFLHFEMVPDRLPDELRTLLQKFPAGSVQLEVGIQSLDDAVSARVSRRQNVAKLEDNLRFLTSQTGVHLHADLIVGLPGEDLETFGRGFDQLHATGVAEIQVGVLKRLRGTPIIRHDDAWKMVYSKSAPYEILQTSHVTFNDAQRMKRFSRYWDLINNSGRFINTIKMLLGETPFQSFLRFSDWLWVTAQTKEGIALPRLAELTATHLVEDRDLDPLVVHDALMADFGKEKIPNALRVPLPKRQARRVTAAC
jgi:radical SAM superfamily enzyme YgiQ (UPF0313 family)